MELKLSKKPKNATIIEGFPGFGLVGTIVTEYLINHLETEMIGKITNEESPVMVAIHNETIVEPLGIFYNKRYNLVIVHAVTPVSGIEWQLAGQLNKLAKMLNAKEIISIEGVGRKGGVSKAGVFFYSGKKQKKHKLAKSGTKPLREGIILGVTGSLLLKADAPLTCIFAETFSELPDSNAAARTIQVLDNYLNLKVDVKPLLKQAKDFEKKLKSLMSQGKEAQEISEKKRMQYVG